MYAYLPPPRFLPAPFLFSVPFFLLFTYIKKRGNVGYVRAGYPIIMIAVLKKHTKTRKKKLERIKEQ